MAKQAGRVKKLFGRYGVLLRFYALLAYFMALLFFATHWKATGVYLEEYYPAFVAQNVAWLIRLLGVKASASGTSVSLPGFAFRIIFHCAGGYGMIIFASAVMAYPARWSERLLGLLLGLPTLYLINTVRMVALGFIGMYYKNLFDYFHEYLWQGIFIIFVIVLWMFWKEKMVRDESAAGVPG